MLQTGSSALGTAGYGCFPILILQFARSVFIAIWVGHHPEKCAAATKSLELFRDA
jgi:hypothetical protein